MNPPHLKGVVRLSLLLIAWRARLGPGWHAGFGPGQNAGGVQLLLPGRSEQALRSLVSASKPPEIPKKTTATSACLAAAVAAANAERFGQPSESQPGL